MSISTSLTLVVKAIESDLKSFSKSSDISRVACAPGCGSCCLLNVSVLFPEAVAIARYVQRTQPVAIVEDLKRRLKLLSIKTKWLTDEERVFAREPCAFLNESNSCMIHNVRPLMCRAITSTDPAKCRESIAMMALDNSPVVEMDLFHKKFIETVYTALTEGLNELGLDSRPNRLSTAVFSLLDDDGISTSFLAGKPVVLH